jgi:UDP-N-acetylmuramoyl-L-alanyl-D-glutamate--2,6-diaminopimelate ligase
MKSLIKKLIPKFLLQYYHKAMALLGASIYGNPAEKMIVVGVTGTNGKSTTVALIAKVLESNGTKVGALSTVYFKVADEEVLNNKKMTMLGRFLLQKYLRRMVDAGCRYAVVETSSQGIEQFRHLGINYDYAVFTNLTPEHIEAHGGFENYKKAKGKLFAFLTSKPRKTIDEKEIKKISVINVDDEHASYFSGFAADKKITFACKNSDADFVASDVKVSTQGTEFMVGNEEIKMKLIGAFNAYNSLAAIAIAREEGYDWSLIKKGLESVAVVPGRTEIINEGQNFHVMVDYAPDPYSLIKLYETIDIIEKNKLIHVLGSCGGGRDKARRPILGQMAGEKADLVIVTNEDPYDDDPMEIIDAVTAGALEKGKVLDQNLFKILDRREAIAKALSLAQPGDLVLITGKGAEQAMAVADGKYVPWDDRAVVREELKRCQL